MQPTIDDFARKLIRRQARRLIEKFSLPRSDREDLEQDLTLEVLRRLRHIQDSQGEVDNSRGFLTTLVRRGALNLIKHRIARKRHLPKCKSLSDTMRGPDGRRVERGQTIESAQRL